MNPTAPNDVPHAPPHVGADWRLAPVEFQWFGKSDAEICRQMRDRNRNGERDAADLVAHLRHEEHVRGVRSLGLERRRRPYDSVTWRSAPRGSFDDHVNDMAAWGAAGQPCPGD